MKDLHKTEAVRSSFAVDVCCLRQTLSSPNWIGQPPLNTQNIGAQD
jgi:hypothetical protein